MKTRDSLVSNSSSSSFIIIGETCSMMELTEKDIECGLVVTGRFLSEGQDVFTINSKGMLKFIQDHPGPFVIYKNAKVHSEASSLIEIDVEGPATVVGGTKDQNSSYDIDRLLDRYEDLVEEELQNNIEVAKEKFREQYK